MRSMIIGLTLCLVAPAALAAESVEDAIAAANQQFVAAFNQGDAAAVAARYTEDAALLPPGEARVDGNAAIAAYWKGAIEAGFKDLTLNAVEVTDGGGTAAEVGIFTMGVPTADQGPQQATGKYIVLWQRGADGQWRIHRDMWNDDPAAK